MSVEIETVTISAVDDKRLVLGNASAAFLHSQGNNFVRRRIGFRMAVDDTGANLTGTPRFYYGLMSSPSAGVANGPLGATTNHFLGVRSNGSTWTRATSPTRYSFGTGNHQLLKRINTTDTSIATSTAGALVPAEPTTRRSIWILDVLKGSPNWTISAVAGNNTTHPDTSLEILQTAMNILTMTSVSAYLTAITGAAYGAAGSGTHAVDEATDGALNAIVLAWDRISPLMYVSEIMTCDFPF